MRAAIKEVMIGQSWMMKQAKQRLALPTNAQCQPVASCQPADTLLRIVGFLKSPGWNTPEGRISLMITQPAVAVE